MNIIEIIRCY